MARTGVTLAPSDWGAKYASHYTQSPIGPVSRVICHHTAGAQPNTPADLAPLLRSLENYGHNRDGADIEYHVLVDQFGQVGEGFAPRYRGAHCNSSDPGNPGKSFNSTSLGLCFIGYFYPNVNNQITPAATEAAAAWLACRVKDGDLYTAALQEPASPSSSGWRPHNSVYATACPGNLYPGPLRNIFARAVQLAGGATPVPPQPQPVPPNTGTGTLGAFPLPTSDCYAMSDGTRYTHNGSNSTDKSNIKRIQNRLMELGFALPKYGADGMFGSETKSAVKAFQNGKTTADGMVGPKTWGLL